jgi:hypothetical protein
LASVFGFVLLSFFKNKNIVILSFIGVAMLLIYFQQISDIHRIMPLERAFIGLGAVTTITLPIIILLKKLKISHLSFNNIKRIKSRDPVVSPLGSENKKPNAFVERFKSVRLTTNIGFFQTHETNSKILSVYIILIFVFMFPVIMTPFDTYKDPYTTKGYDFTNYTFEELTAAEWIKENIPKNFKIYSDPSTVIEMRGLSDRPHIEGISWNTTIANEVGSVLVSENATYAHQSILTNHGNNTIIVISPRTSEWIKGDTYFVQYPINEFNYFQGVQKFFNEDYFELQHRDDNIMIFTLR